MIPYSSRRLRWDGTELAPGPANPGSSHHRTSWPPPRHSRLLPVLLCLAGGGLLIALIVYLLADVQTPLPHLAPLPPAQNPSQVGRIGHSVRHKDGFGKPSYERQMVPPKLLSRQEEGSAPFVPASKPLSLGPSKDGHESRDNKTGQVAPDPANAGSTFAATPRSESPPRRVRTDAVPRPVIPRHYPHIRLAMLAYHGNPMGAFEDRLLKKSIDLVVPHVTYLKHIQSVAPKTPRLIYSNTSNLYLTLLTDWLNYADAKGLSREAAFYHAAEPRAFSGGSPSSQPVTWFWGIYRGGKTLADLTTAARSGSGRIAFGSAGESLYVGYPERFREINLELLAGRRQGWTARLEYTQRASAAGTALKWTPLPLRTDGTDGLKRSGQITFDPAAGWKTATVNGSPRLFYVRFRTVRAGVAPVAARILGRDYVAARGTDAGTVPVFDFWADQNHDGYLDDAEYARRASGKDARFVYESRMLTDQYGQMRYSTNPADSGFRKWAVRFHLDQLKRYPLATGFFMDNCDGRPPVTPAAVRESVATYAQDYGAMLQAIHRAMARTDKSRWLLCNTVLNSRADPVVQYNPAYMEEFAIRPLAHNWLSFEDLAEGVARRARLVSPPPLAVLDSHPQGGAQLNPRMQLATLAYYYLLSDPDSTFLMVCGGVEPASPWQNHWIGAVKYNVGRPLAPWSLWKTGADPASPALHYRIYQRPFTKALVLYKPLPYTQGAATQVSLDSETATQHDLHGVYRPLRANGSLLSPTRAVSLRNGEGAILIKSK